VLRVIGERPGVTARQLAATSKVTGGTLYSLLRRLTVEGTLEKRELPGGQAGYALAAHAPTPAEPAVSEPEAATTEANAATEPSAATELSAAAAAEVGATRSSNSSGGSGSSA
jgi:hypothetical protein